MYELLQEEVHGALWMPVHHGDDAAIMKEFLDLLTWQEHAMHGKAKQTFAMKALAD